MARVVSASVSSLRPPIFSVQRLVGTFVCVFVVRVGYMAAYVNTQAAVGCMHSTMADNTPTARAMEDNTPRAACHAFSPWMVCAMEDNTPHAVCHVVWSVGAMVTFCVGESVVFVGEFVVMMVYTYFGYTVMSIVSRSKVLTPCSTPITVHTPSPAPVDIHVLFRITAIVCIHCALTVNATLALLRAEIGSQVDSLVSGTPDTLRGIGSHVDLVSVDHAVVPREASGVPGPLPARVLETKLSPSRFHNTPADSPDVAPMFLHVMYLPG